MDEWLENEEPTTGGTPKYQEREFLILVVAAILYGVASMRGAEGDTMAFLENLLLVSTGGFGIARGLDKHGRNVGGGAS